jgi:hypothetical protein
MIYKQKSRYLGDDLLVLGDTVGDGNLDADVCGDVHALLLALRYSLGRLEGLALLLRNRHAHLLAHRLTVFPAWQKNWESSTLIVDEI